PAIAELALVAARNSPPETGQLLLSGLRQLLKACLYGEFTQCRESYCQTSADGRCRRQQWDTARGRISGSPCVDCPFYVQMSQAEHAALLQSRWAIASIVPYAEAPEVFLPEDFRAFRR